MDKQHQDLQQRIGHRYADPALLERALTHRSYSNEHPRQPHSERLEFLGDAVLGLLVSDALYSRCSDASEGELSRRRASLVNTRALARVARRIDLGEALRMGRGELATGGRDKTSLLADAVEALIGAAYLDGGLEPARALVERLIGDEIRRVAAEVAPRDYKSELQERQQHQGKPPPRYTVVDSSGPDHAKRFVVEAAEQPDGLRARGEGSSKRSAERDAARALLERLDQEPSD